MAKRDSADVEVPATADYALEWLSAPERLLDQARTEPDALEQRIRSLDAAHAYRAASLIDAEAMMLGVADTGTRRLLLSIGDDASTLSHLIDWDAAEAAQLRSSMNFEEPASEAMA